MKKLTLLFLCSLALSYAKKPNIIYIIADDLGYGDLSCYGQKHFSTPHLDQLAGQSLTGFILKSAVHQNARPLCTLPGYGVVVNQVCIEC